MGGYAAYVWPCYFFAAAVMLAVAMTSLRSLKRAKKRLEALQNDAERA